MKYGEINFIVIHKTQPLKITVYITNYESIIFTFT